MHLWEINFFFFYILNCLFPFVLLAFSCPKLCGFHRFIFLVCHQYSNFSVIMTVISVCELMLFSSVTTSLSFHLPTLNCCLLAAMWTNNFSLPLILYLKMGTIAVVLDGYVGRIKLINLLKVLRIVPYTWFATYMCFLLWFCVFVEATHFLKSFRIWIQGKLV